VGAAPLELLHFGVDHTHTLSLIALSVLSPGLPSKPLSRRRSRSFFGKEEEEDEEEEEGFICN